MTNDPDKAGWSVRDLARKKKPDRSISLVGTQVFVSLESSERNVHDSDRRSALSFKGLDSVGNGHTEQV